MGKLFHYYLESIQLESIVDEASACLKAINVETIKQGTSAPCYL